MFIYISEHRILLFTLHFFSKIKTAQIISPISQKQN